MSLIFNQSNLLSYNEENKKYEVEAVLFAKIDKDASTFNVLQSNIVMKLMKEDKEAEFWPRLLSDKLKEKTNVKVDWDKYVDEDEADGADFDAEDMGITLFCCSHKSLYLF